MSAASAKSWRTLVQRSPDSDGQTALQNLAAVPESHPKKDCVSDVVQASSLIQRLVKNLDETTHDFCKRKREAVMEISRKKQQLQEKEAALAAERDLFDSERAALAANDKQVLNSVERQVEQDRQILETISER